MVYVSKIYFGGGSTAFSLLLLNMKLAGEDGLDARSILIECQNKYRNILPFMINHMTCGT